MIGQQRLNFLSFDSPALTRNPLRAIIKGVNKKYRSKLVMINWRLSLCAVCITSIRGLVSITLFSPLLTHASDVPGAFFQDVTREAALNTKPNPWRFGLGNPTWVDLNNDGLLDMVASHHSHPPNIYLNTGYASFIETFKQSGLYANDIGRDHHGLAWGDANNDGNIDVFVAEGTWSGLLDPQSALWLGDGSGKFRVAPDAIFNFAGRPAMWADVENDGDLDLLVLAGRQSSAGSVMLQLNNGDATFLNGTDVSGLGALLSSLPLSVASFADIDNDGDMDLLVGGGAPMRLLLNDGLGRFTDGQFPETSSRGQGVAWGDFDNDGLLDVAINFGVPDYYKGLVTDANRVEFCNMMRLTESPQGLNIQTTADSLAFELFGGKNPADPATIFYGFNSESPVSNLFTLQAEAAQGQPSFVPGSDYGFFIWTNEYHEWFVRWSNDQHRKGFSGIISAQGDPLTRIETTYTPYETEFTTELYHNDGGGRFSRVTDSAGLTSIGNFRSGLVWGDYDNDGDVDLYVADPGTIAGNKPNRLYQNNGNGTFQELAHSAGVAATDVDGRHYGAAWGDYDNDGFLDLFLMNGNGWGYRFAPGNEALFRNLGNGNNWIKLQLEGVISNRSALGARVVIEAGGVSQTRLLNGGGGGEYYSQGSGPLHFGLGAAESVDRLTIYWPGGLEQSIENVHANQMIKIIEDVGTPLPQPGDLQFNSATYSVAEGGGSLLVTVSRTGGSDGAVSVDYSTADDTATATAAGADYTAASGTLNFADGELSQTFSVTILDDSVYEGDESLNLVLSNPSGGAALGTQASAVLTIADDDLTIEITRAVYQTATQKPVVYATSALGANAALKITYHGAAGESLTRLMVWQASNDRWKKIIQGFVTKFGFVPVSVTVVGPEGSETATLQ